MGWKNKKSTISHIQKEGENYKSIFHKSKGKAMRKLGSGCSCELLILRQTSPIQEWPPADRVATSQKFLPPGKKTNYLTK